MYYYLTYVSQFPVFLFRLVPLGHLLRRRVFTGDDLRSVIVLPVDRDLLRTLFFEDALETWIVTNLVGGFDLYRALFGVFGMYFTPDDSLTLLLTIEVDLLRPFSIIPKILFIRLIRETTSDTTISWCELGTNISCNMDRISFVTLSRKAADSHRTPEL